MRPVTMLMLALVFALAGTAALADSCNVCGSAPAPVCPPVAEVCPPVCPPIPAAVGAGPVPKICNAACPEEFDAKFIPAVYQNNQDIIALAQMGVQQASSKELRDLSGKIRYERTRHNMRLVQFARSIGQCDLNLACNTCVTDQLSTLVGQDFNIRYAVLMIGLLMQAQEAAQMGITQSCMGDLRNQNRISARAAQNEIMALQNWLARNGVGVQAGAFGAGPTCPTIPPPTPCPAPCVTPCPPPVACPTPCPAPAAGPACPAPCPAPVVAPATVVPVPCPAPCP